jgi:hypothetical protein
MSKIQILLSAANMGPNATEADFDAWASYVAANIDEALSIDADVDQAGFTGRTSISDDEVSGATEEQEEAIDRWLGNEGWDAWCSSVAPGQSDAGIATLRAEHV